jgi:hypothetical protein
MGYLGGKERLVRMGNGKGIERKGVLFDGFDGNEFGGSKWRF